MADYTEIIFCEGEPRTLPTYYNVGDLSLFAGGKTTSGAIKQIDLFNVVYGTYTHEYGELVNNISSHSGCSDSISGYFGGWTDDLPNQGVIDKFNFYNGSFTADRWGSLLYTMSETTAISNGSYGIWAGGYYTNPIIMQYIVLASGGETSDWGNLREAVSSAGSFANQTYGIVAGGYNRDTFEVTEQVNRISWASQANASNAGDLTVLREGLEGAGNDDIGFLAGGYNGDLDVTYTTIEEWNINLSWSGAPWGDLSQKRTWFAGSGNNTTALFGGGSYLVGGGAIHLTSVESIFYASGGDTSNFGDLDNATRFFGSAAGAGGQNNPIPEDPPVGESGDNNGPIYTPDPCYKGLFLGGEFAGDYSVKLNIKSAAMSTLYNTLLRDAAFTIRATSDMTTAHIGTGSSWWGWGWIDKSNIASESAWTGWGTINDDRSAASSASDNISSFWIGGDGEPTIDSLAFANGAVTLDWGSWIDGEDHEWGTSACDGTTIVIGPIDNNYSPGKSRFDQIAAATGGTTTGFGETSIGWWDCKSVKDATRMIIWSGYSIDLDTGDWHEYSERMESFEFATGVTSSFFGTLNNGREYSGSCEDETTGILGTGYAGQYYTQYDYIIMAIESSESYFADIWAGADRGHDYGCTAGGCYVPDVPSANCEDTTMFELYSYIGFVGIDFDSNMPDIQLFDTKDTDVDLLMDNIVVGLNLDPSLSDIRTLQISNCIFNTADTLYYSNIPDVTVQNLELHPSEVVFSEDYSALNISNSRIFVLDISAYISLSNDIDINAVELNSSFVKEMDVNLIRVIV